MRVVVTTETRFHQTPDGRVWTSGGFNYSSWARYLSVFDHVRVVARTRQTPHLPDGVRQVDGERVEVWPIPYYQGPRAYLLRRPVLGRRIAAAVEPADAVILRSPSAIGTLLAEHLGRLRQPYALEVIGDPWEVFAPNAVRHPLRPALRHWFTRQLRCQCAAAVAVAYETEHALQVRYPARQDAYTVGVSCVDLDETAFVPAPRAAARHRPELLVSVGSLEQMYKGVDTLVDAVHRLAVAGTPVRLVHVGVGRYRPYLEDLARRLGVADRVTFTGWLPSVESLRRQLDEADLFVIPSRTEGLPRALIEAMARALPAIGTTVGGIPELLPAADLVPPSAPEALAEAIGAMLSDPGRMAAASARNLARAREFSSAALTPRREGFYRAVRAAVAPPVRVAHVLGVLDRGGAETVALDICRELPADEFAQVFLTLGGRTGSLAPEFQHAGASIRQCPLQPKGTFALRLWRCLREIRPDVVVSHICLASGAILAVARLNRVPVRIARLQSDGDGRPDTLPRRAVRTGMRWLLRWHATDVVAVTAAALRFARPPADDRRYRVLYNSVDPARVGGWTRPQARRKWRIPPDALVIGYVGRAHQVKNRPFLVDVHRAVRTWRDDARLLVAGPGGVADLTGAHPDLVDDPLVTLTGEVEEVGSVLTASNVLLLPSLMEGLPGVILEALAVGTPVVASDLPCHREVATHVPGLTLVPLADGARRWAAEAIRAAGLGETERQEIRDALHESPFLLTNAAQQWRTLWRSGIR